MSLKPLKQFSVLTLQHASQPCRSRFLLLSGFIFVVLGNTACSRDSADPLQAKIHNFYGAEGFWLDYFVSCKSIRIMYGNDFGQQDKLVWESEITNPHLEELRVALRDLSLTNLKEVYEDPSVDDGAQLTFEFELNGGKKRKIEVRNLNQPDLQSFVKVVNKCIPSKYKLSEEWSMDSGSSLRVKSGQ